MKPSITSPEYKTAISVAQMREADAYTIANFVPGRELMFRAARGVYDSLDWKDKKVAIVCGSGNNGGDGYALATILAEQGGNYGGSLDASRVSSCESSALLPHIYRTSEKFSDDGLYYYEAALKAGVPAELFTSGTKLDGYDVVVDCVLGTGFSGTPRGTAAEAISAINDSYAFVVSVDINSGMNGDSGEAELAVRSDLTVSIGFYKTGLFAGRAPELIGDLLNVDIGIIMPAE